MERDERHEQRLIEHVEAVDPLDPVVLCAADEVLTATGEGLFIERPAFMVVVE